MGKIAEKRHYVNFLLIIRYYIFYHIKNYYLIFTRKIKMTPADLQALAHQFMINAVKTAENQNIWIEYCGDDAKILADACAEQVKNAGANAHMVNSSAKEINSTIGTMSEQEIEQWGEQQLATMKTMHGYIRITDDNDDNKIKLSKDTNNWFKKAKRIFTNYRVENTNWLVVSTPNEYFAQTCNMKMAEFEEFYKQACLANYSAMATAAEPLVKIMTEGKKVRIYSPQQETDLTFSIEGIPAIPCTGKVNIPDGEIFTAPVKNSVNGTIKFSKSNYDGERFEWIKLKIENGKIIEATAGNKDRTVALNRIFDVDDGARYFGEFAINFNPYILHSTGDILFDEKISGGLHLAAGSCYKEAPNGNSSANHWDMVHIQRPEYGGGEIWIDDILIRKDGLFVPEILHPLNPEELKKTSLKPNTLGL